MVPADLASPAPASAPAPLEDLVAQYETLLGALEAKDPPSCSTVYPLLLLRDQVAAVSGRDGSVPPLAVAEKICTLDRRLRRVLMRTPLDGGATLEELRDAVQPPDQNWWWQHLRSPSPWWTVGAVLLLTFSVTLITDFTRRILSNDPDDLGILTIAVQALFAVAATSTFTDSGRQWIEAVLAHFDVKSQYQPRWKLAATGLLFAIVLTIWASVPDGLAWRSNNQAVRAENANSPEALPLYQRAIALNPEMPQAHFNLGTFYEKSYQYDKATGEYQEALVVDPEDLRAYANLSRLFILANQPFNALRVADDGVKAAAKVAAADPKRADPQTVASLHKDLAWAEFQLGFYSDAQTDAEFAAGNPNVAPSANCVLGRIFTQQGNSAQAQQAWKNFNASLQVPNVAPPIIEPDCSRMAEQALLGKPEASPNEK